MARSVSQYLHLLQSFLPWGRAWTREKDKTMTKLLQGLATEFNRLDGRVDDLFTERDTRTTDELLEEYERDFTIPDEYEVLADTEDERRSVLNTKLVSVGRQDKGYFGKIANDLGRSIYIIEHTSAVCGSARCGDWCGSARIQFYWTTVIRYTPNEITYFQAGASSAGDLLADLPLMDYIFTNFNRYRPAHTINLWGFYGGGLSSGFDCGFATVPWLDGPVHKLVGGGFDLGFNVGYDINYRIDVSDYFTGGFNVGFSGGFDRIQNATGFELFE